MPQTYVHRLFVWVVHAISLGGAGPCVVCFMVLLIDLEHVGRQRQAKRRRETAAPPQKERRTAAPPIQEEGRNAAPLKKEGAWLSAVLGLASGYFGSFQAALAAGSFGPCRPATLALLDRKSENILTVKYGVSVAKERLNLLQ